jgi:hypothetical protein
LVRRSLYHKASLGLSCQGVCFPCCRTTYPEKPRSLVLLWSRTRFQQIGSVFDESPNWVPKLGKPQFYVLHLVEKFFVFRVFTLRFLWPPICYLGFYAFLQNSKVGDCFILLCLGNSKSCWLRHSFYDPPSIVSSSNHCRRLTHVGLDYGLANSAIRRGCAERYSKQGRHMGANAGGRAVQPRLRSAGWLFCANRDLYCSI